MFATRGDCPTISDRIRGRRPGDRASFHESLCLQAVRRDPYPHPRYQSRRTSR